MYLTDEILDKLNARNRKKDGNLKAGAVSEIMLPDIMVRSFAEVKVLAGDTLTWGEKNFLYQQAQKELKENRMAESRILSRANPQLANAVRLSIRQSPMLGGYDDLFPQRASNFVKPGAVASMFSPAGYLTELYREARSLHPDTSQYHLDTRRPDLASLSLSQPNMDDELSTLSLSNELLLNNIQSEESLDYDDVIEKLADYRLTGATPYSQPYEAIRQAILLQDPAFEAFRNNPSVAEKMDTGGLLGITSNLPPALHNILTEEITEKNADALIKKNFGDIDVATFQNLAYMARYYGVTNDELASMLGMVLAGENLNPGVQLYQNDQLVALNNSNGALLATVIKREYLTRDTDFIDWIEIVPVGEGWYNINLSFHFASDKFTTIRIGSSRTENYSHDIVDEKFELLEKNKIYSFNRNLIADDKGIYISVSAYDDSTDGYFSAVHVNFTSIDYDFSVFLLKLNKLIRLYKATGISPSDIQTVIESVNDNLAITDYVLSRLFWVNYYAQHYGIDFSDALVLAGANISQIAHSGKDSAFTRLFNTPLLNNQQFSPDGAVLDLEPGKSEDTFRLGALKRALQVNDTQLYTLYTLTFTDKDGESKAIDFTTTITNLSALYRTRLLAEVNHLSITELSLMLSVSPYAGQKLDTLTAEALNGLSAALERYTQWLKDMNWTVSDLYLMLTGSYSTTLSPDIDNLVTTLHSGLRNQDISRDNNDETDETRLVAAMAPFIAAALQLDSAEMAGALLTWLNQLRPGNLTVVDFLTLTDKERTDDETSDMVAYCQVMGQLALFARSAGLNAAELLWVTQHPTIFTEKATVLAHDVATLHDITALHAFLARCGTHASEILTSLSGDAYSDRNLSVRTVAAALALDEQALSQALAQCSGYEYFYSWIHLREALQWLDVATTFGITPDDVAKMVALKYSGENASPYDTWVTVSKVLQAGLNEGQTVRLAASLDESLSAAASAYVIKNIAPSWVTDRDKLYSWLLIDNQVSAQVKTTRIAEAIASVQLYVSRALSAQEGTVDNAVKSKAFFTSDWDAYNKRYSTWAGVSQLVYYPENYVDPTLRIGQTGMMDEMLQALSQSQLTSDTVENAFKTYMTRFEEIANLEVISGYHDSVSDQNGITYLVGRSAIGDYYWRSADIGKMSDGKLPANGWTEWKKITTALTPVNNLVRPVIFQSRLYLAWVESREVATYDKDKTTQGPEYLLKYAHILHDGTWSAPVSVALESSTLPIQKVSINITGMYCSFDASEDRLSVIFYEKKAKYSANPENINGVLILSDHSVVATTNLWAFAYMQFDTSGNICLNTPVIQPSVEIKSQRPIWGTGSYSFGNGGQVIPILKTDSNIIGLSLSAECRLIFDSTSQTDKGRQINLLKKISDIGEYILIANHTEHKMESSGGKMSLSSVTIKKTVNEKVSYITYFHDETIKMNRPDISAGGLYNITTLFGEDDIKYDEASNCLVFESETPPFQINFIVHYGVFEFFELIVNEFIEMDTSNLKMSYLVTLGRSHYTLAAQAPINEIKPDWNETLFRINTDGQIPLCLDDFTNNSADAELHYSIRSNNFEFGGESFLCKFNLGLTVPVITLVHENTLAQYIQYGIYRIRVNTLFARQLIARANQGLNAVLSMDTQQLQEPKLGKGAYVTLELDKYDASVNGTSPAFDVLMCDVFVQNDRFTLASGTLSANQKISCSFFLPRLDESTESPENMVFCVKFQVGESTKIVVGEGEGAWKVLDKDSDADADAEKLYKTITRIRIDNQTTEPMDFSGANALYFWEMFYYVPMMVFKRLLSESRFTEATQWIKYIWTPDGYLVNDQPAIYTWNVRPLEEETTWHAAPLDSVDPDAVAQADPLHYKIATFMSYLDLLIARGDTAYRQLERDTLNEAKMWYTQALNILGDEAYLEQGSNWAAPRLSDAADKTTQKDVQQALMAVRQPLVSGELRTANSLTGLFLPQQNAKLAGYRQTLAQRLYNLRHNLSIDGSPLSLAIYATPADPAALLSAAVNSASGDSDLPPAEMPLYRFPVILESARSMVGQLTQFGSTLLSITERQDAEALSELLQAQGSELVRQGIALQTSTLSEIDAEKTVLEESRSGAQSRLNSYSALYDEDVSGQEETALNLRLAASGVNAASKFLFMSAAAADMVPNIYGMAVGGARYGALFNATAIGMQIASDASQITSDGISQKEMWRRRRQEWEIQRNNAESEVKQMDAQLKALAVRREGAVLQKTYLETQQSQTQAQMAFLQNKFTSRALYNWLRGKLAAIYYQFYDLTVSRCLMAQEAYNWSLGTTPATFIRPGAWQGTYAGLMAGESLMLNLAQMEQSYLQKDERKKEVTRTVCLSEVYAGLSSDDFVLSDALVKLVNDGKGSAGMENNGVAFDDKENLLQATLKLADLNIPDDYPSSLGTTRRIKQISVTLPALTGPYQDVQAVLSYGGSVKLPRGCQSAAISHGMNDSGQFQLDFNDARWLPFEGIPLADSGTLTLSFPQADSRQKALLLTLTDIILHIRYTISETNSQ